jgi:hypothetical protein
MIFILCNDLFRRFQSGPVQPQILTLPNIKLVFLLWDQLVPKVLVLLVLDASCEASETICFPVYLLVKFLCCDPPSENLHSFPVASVHSGVIGTALRCTSGFGEAALPTWGDSTCPLFVSLGDRIA